MKILYLHGLHSKPGGFKPTFLHQQGHEVINPALPDDDFARSVEIAQAAYGESRPVVIVGSSRGGAVAVNIDAGPTPLVLIAPAWRRWGTATRSEGERPRNHPPQPGRRGDPVRGQPGTRPVQRSA